MKNKLFHCFLVLAALPLLCGFCSAADEVINEDFEEGVISGNLLNNALIQDLADGRGSMLSLTQGANSQSGFAWFDTPFNLQDSKVEIEFDFYIRTGISADPADGMSVIFQFGDNIAATGGGGGGLGTSNFPTDYVSVAFDIWDNGGADPETACDVGNRTCHIEVNQNSNPGGDLSKQTNIDFGVPIPSFTEVGDSLFPFHARIIFDSGHIQVFLQTDGPPIGFESFEEEVMVLDAVLEEFPADADAIIGFAASTGGANAHHEIDNLVVLTDEATPQVNVDLRLGDGNRGAINCGGAEDVTGDVGGETYTFVRDVPLDYFIGTDTSVVPNENQFADYGYTTGLNASALSGLAIANLGDAALEPMYQIERWDNAPVTYQFGVNSGRFEVNLHFAENCPGCGISATGDATRRISAMVEGEEVLTHWSAALAAGNEAGTGPVAATAVVRTFQVDVNDDYLEVMINDLGVLGTPPENAQINGISYRRIGDVTGAPVSGDMEDFGPIALPNAGEIVVVDTDFEDDEVGFCPEGWTCNDSGIFSPQVVDSSERHLVFINNRLRLTGNLGNCATTVIYDEPVNLAAYGFEAEFTVHLTQPEGVAAADGMTFFYVEGEDEILLNSLGAGGGALAFPAEATFGIEIDTYQGTNDPSGIPQNGYGHVGLIINGNVTQHIQTSSSYRSDITPDNWPIALDDNQQFVTNTAILEENEGAGFRVKVSLNNDRLQAWVASVNTIPADGFVMPETKVLDTLLSYGGVFPQQGYFGFSGATGGAISYHEVDDVKIALILNKAAQVTRAPLEQAFYTDDTTPVNMALDIVIEPDTGAHDLLITEVLPEGWSATAISDGGAFADGEVTWNLADVAADTSIGYTLIPSPDTKAPVIITGSFSVAGNEALGIPDATLLYSPPMFPLGAATVLLDEDFDGMLGCPDNWTCNETIIDDLFEPGVVGDGSEHDGRFQLSQDQVPNQSTRVIYNEPIDLTANSFVAAFDVYISNLAGANPADGLTFMIVDAAGGEDTLFLNGTGGGALGYGALNYLLGAEAINPRSLAVELDLWFGGEDPNGYNTDGYGHMGIIRDGQWATHVQTNIDYDPTMIPSTLGGSGWPLFSDQLGAGKPLHVEVTYNNGNVSVTLQADDPVDGGDMFEEPVEVLNAPVCFYDDDLPDSVLQSAYIGFTAATGGSFATQEIDNLTVTLYAKGTATGVGVYTGDVNNDGSINLADAISLLTHLFVTKGLPCLKSADANDDGKLDLADAISILTYQFQNGTLIGPDGVRLSSAQTGCKTYSADEVDDLGCDTPCTAK